MPAPHARCPPPSTACFQLSTADSRLLCSNSFRFTQFRKNASASPLESHSFKTKDLKCPVFTHFQKKGGGPPTVKSKEGRRTRRTQGQQSGVPKDSGCRAIESPHSKRAAAASTSRRDCGINGDEGHRRRGISTNGKAGGATD